MTKAEVLASLEPLFAHTNAEDEGDRELSTYFVETDVWRRVASGTKDIVMGAKGAGKSAIYLLLLQRGPSPNDKGGTILVPAEEPLGASVFLQAINERLEEDARSRAPERLIGRVEFGRLWQRYFVVLILSRLRQDARKNAEIRKILRSDPEVKSLISAFEQSGLLARERERQFSLHQTLAQVMRSVRVTLMVPPVEVDVTADIGGPAADLADVATSEPTDPFECLERVLAALNLTVWVLVDRLDDAFENQSPMLETIGLSTLLQTYVNLKRYRHIRLKLFVRSDIYGRALGDSARVRGREKIESEAEIDWDESALLDVVMRRMVQSQALRKMYGLTAGGGSDLHDREMRERLFYRIFPAQIGPRATLSWMLGRLEDGYGRVAPRPLIRFVSIALERQGKRRVDAHGELLLDAISVEEAAGKASIEYYDKAFRPEFPLLRDYAHGLLGQPEGNTFGTLYAVWRAMPQHHNLSERTALRKAQELTEAGFFRHADDDPFYWVAPLYQAALKIRRGSSTLTPRDPRPRS